MIALEKCYLPNLPEGLGNLTISSLSLSANSIFQQVVEIPPGIG